MGKEPLDPESILCLIRLYRKVFDYLEDLRSQDSTASYIQFPKIAPVLSESLAIHLMRSGRLLPQLDNPIPGGAKADILAEEDGRQVKVEVKATGESAFQYFGVKDISADYLVWMHFGACFRREGNDLAVYVLRSPGLHFHSTGKITLRKFQQVAVGNLTSTRLSIGEALGG